MIDTAQAAFVGNKPHELAGAREEAHNPGIPQHTTLGIHSSHTKSQLSCLEY